MKFLIVLALGIVAAAMADETQLLRDFTNGNIQFTANVYKELLKTNSGNFLVCPISADVILALVHVGARGATASQLSSGLHIPESTEEVQKTVRVLSPKLQGNDHYVLSSANKIYIKEGFSVKSQFKSVAVDVFKSDIQSIDFGQKAQAAKTMNSWVEEKTHDKIHDLISPDDLDEDTRLVLINALYFQGKWVNQFSEYATTKGDFYLNNNDKVKVDFMEQTSHFQYAENDKAQFLELPYEGGDVSLTIVLPKDKQGLSAIEQNVADVLVRPQFGNQRVHVKLPKFKIETTIQFNDILKTLGITEAFGDNADFSELSDTPLKISKVIQKTFIEVNENGTTAAAATAVFDAVIRSGLLRRPQPPVQFVANRPFLYALRHSSGPLLFVGRFNSK